MSKLKHFKEFETYSEYETYINGKPMLPNVSFVGENVYYKDGEPHPEDYFNFGVDTSEVESTDTSIINTYDTNYPSITFEFTGIVTAITDNNGVITANFNENTIEQQQTGSVIAKHNDTIVGIWTITQKAYEKPDYSKQYLTFKITGDGDINVPTGTTYSINVGEWENTGTTLTVSGGESIRFKGNNTTYNENTFSASSAVFEVEGNIMSLLYGDDFINQSSLLESRTFYLLFNGCTGLTTVENLILPATSLQDYCYSNMFAGCTSLVTAPSILPATTLASNCYVGMFASCTSLVTAPELPATTLANYCYLGMFSYCTSLVTAPELPATTLANYCYQYMFQGCTSLVTAPSILPATTLAITCYSNMFQGCTSLVTAPELPATTLASNCYQYMFQGCTSLVTAPELPATTLTYICYSNMFNGCTSLNYIKCLATANIGGGYTRAWVNGVASSGTFVKAAGVTWPTGTSGIPSGWTVEEV